MKLYHAAQAATAIALLLLGVANANIGNGIAALVFGALFGFNLALLIIGLANDKKEQQP